MMIGAGLGLTEMAARARGGGAGPPPPPPPLPPPPPPPFARFPVLAAAYAAGRALISIIGDSTSMAWGAGTGGGGMIGGNQLTTARYLRDRLGAGGIVTTDGCFGFGDHHAAEYGVPQGDILAFYTPGLSAGAAWGFQPGLESPWGAQLLRDQSASDALTFTPAGSYDRIETFNLKYPGLGTFQISRGGSVLVTINEDAPVGLSRQIASVAAGAGALSIIGTIGGGTIFPGAVRVWNSAVGAQVQVEPLGVSGWQTSDWLIATNAFSPGNALSSLGTHLAIVNLGLNDKYFGRSAAAYKADLKTIAAKLKAAGSDVLLAIPHLDADPGNIRFFDAAWSQAVIDAAAELGLPAPIDLRTIGLVAADYADDVHLKASGYAKIGGAYATRLLAA